MKFRVGRTGTAHALSAPVAGTTSRHRAENNTHPTLVTLMHDSNRPRHAFFRSALVLSTASIAACHWVLGIEEGTPGIGSGGQGAITSNGGSAGIGKDASDDADLNLNLDAAMGPRKDFPDARRML